MRRMTTTKDINLIEELNKFIKFQSGELPEIKQGLKLDVSVDDTYYFFGTDGTLRGSDSFDTDGIYCKKTGSIDIYGQEEGVNIVGKHVEIINTENNDSYINLFSYDNNGSCVGTISMGATSADGIKIDVDPDGEGYYFKVLGLPTEDPEVEGALWNDNGTLKISAGE